MAEETHPRPMPDLFTEAMSVEFGIAVTSAVENYATSKEIVERYDVAAGDLSSINPLRDLLGKTLTDFISDSDDQPVRLVGDLEVTVTEIGDGGEDKPRPIPVPVARVTEEEYEVANTKQEDATKTIVELVAGYQSYVAGVLPGLYEGQDLLIPEKAWLLTWERFRDLVKSMEGGYLADFVDMFDCLVELQYPTTYDEMDKTRGREAREDVSARAFYAVMEPHVRRAIRRRGSDNWA